MKKVIFKDKPEANIYGQYNFPDDATIFTFTDSNSIPIRYDKFSDKDLYTTTVDNNLNKDIIDGGLQYNKNSYIHIDKLTIKNNGVSQNIKNIGINVYLVDSLTLDSIDLTDYNDVIDNIGAHRIFTYTPGDVSAGGNLDTIINGGTVITNLNNVIPDYDTSWSTHADAGYNPLESFGGLPIFDFSVGQKIYVMVYTAGDKEVSWWPDEERRNRLHIFEIDTENDLIDPLDSVGGVSQLSFEYADADILEYHSDSSALKPAWKVTDLQLTINTTLDTQDADYNPDEQYHPITGSVTPPVKVELGKNFNSQILRINPSAQISSEETLYNYTPVSKTNILGSQYDLQNYYTSNEERQVASAPTQVSLDFEISTDSVSDETELTSTSPTLGHMFYVISWDDMDNKFKTWDDVIDDIPEDEVKLLEKQQDNLYIFNDIGTPLINNYQTPGIKTIKSVMFSYDTTTTDNTIEPVRWKLITTRIFFRYSSKSIS